MRFNELLKILKKDGWKFLRNGKGSCKIFEHPTKSGVVIVHDHGRQEVRTGTAKAILKQAGIAKKS